MPNHIRKPAAQYPRLGACPVPDCVLTPHLGLHMDGGETSFMADSRGRRCPDVDLPRFTFPKDPTKRRREK
jgi:hypothetical protein